MPLWRRRVRDRRRPPNLYQCHCTLCQKQGGSTSNTATVVDSQRFHWLRGEDNISTWAKPSGFRSHFCTTCGSTVPNPLRDTGYYWVPAGLFEGDEKLRIALHLYTGSRAAWDTVPLSGMSYETMPEMRSFIEALHSASGS